MSRHVLMMEEETKVSQPQSEDAILEDMSQVLNRLNYQAVAIGTELQTQDAEIDQTLHQTEIVQGKLDRANTRLDKLLAKLNNCGSTKTQMCILAILLVIICLLLLFIVYG